MRPSDQQRPLALLLLALVGTGSVAAVGCSGDPMTIAPEDDVVVAAKTPPAISGGTMIVTKDQNTVVAADPDRDVVWIVDLEARALKSKITLNEGDEPGRVVEDNIGRAHVALRSGGAVVTIDIASGKLLDRRDVCLSPRGIAYDAGTDLLHVACAGGQLVTMQAKGGAPTRTLTLDRDLRDVVVSGDKLLVSRFRSAELLVVTVDGKVAQREKAPLGTDTFGFGQSFEPFVAWRMVPKAEGGAFMVHQRALTEPVVIDQPDGYGGSTGCDTGIVQTTVTEVNAPGSIPVAIPTTPTTALPLTALPVDMALSSSGKLAVAAAGSRTVFVTGRGDIENGMLVDPCSPTSNPTTQIIHTDGQPTSVAFRKTNELVVQMREPARIWLHSGDVTIDLPGASVRDTGHEIFHLSSSGQNSLACASCHPEGGQDGRTWNFTSIGLRRTQSIAGGILKTAPLHWDGDMASMETIMDEVFVKRMGGLAQGPRRTRLLARYVDMLPTLPRELPSADDATIERGKALFFDKTVACATCHSGDMLTNNDAADVGTGESFGQRFQVATLVDIATRAPFMHNGCAPTLKDRFTDTICGGGDKHGKTSHLSPEQIDDLVAYLETL